MVSIPRIRREKLAAMPAIAMARGAHAADPSGRAPQQQSYRRSSPTNMVTGGRKSQGRRFLLLKAKKIDLKKMMIFKRPISVDYHLAR
jgi:hypothetical protein